MKRTCGTCEYYDGRDGTCRRNPPIINISGWPGVSCDEWCGEHSAREAPPVEPPIPETREMYGIDLSRYQGEIDWGELSALSPMAGVFQASFAIVKVSEGVGYPIDYAKQLLSSYDALFGIELAYYHFGTPHTSNGLTAAGDAHSEVIDFATGLAQLPYPTMMEFSSGRVANVWCDLEKDVPNLTPDQGLEWCRQFAHSIEELGYRLGWYTSEKWLEENVANYEELLTRSDGTERPFWVARYGMNDGTVPDREKYDPNEKVPEAWGSYDVWQYSSNGDVSGVEEKCDLNLAEVKT